MLCRTVKIKEYFISFHLKKNKMAIGKYLIVSKGKKTCGGCSELGRTVMIVLQEEATWGGVC